MRGPSFANLQALAPMLRGALIADAIAIVSTIDPVLGRRRPVRAAVAGRALQFGPRRARRQGSVAWPG